MNKTETETETNDPDGRWFPPNKYRRMLFGAGHIAVVRYSFGHWFFEATPIWAWLLCQNRWLRREMTEEEIKYFKSSYPSQAITEKRIAVVAIIVLIAALIIAPCYRGGERCDVDNWDENQVSRLHISTIVTALAFLWLFILEYKDISPFIKSCLREQ